MFSVGDRLPWEMQATLLDWCHVREGDTDHTRCLARESNHPFGVHVLTTVEGEIRRTWLVQYGIGDPFPNVNVEEWNNGCGTTHTSSTGSWTCTLPEGHEYSFHLAGTGTGDPILDIWPVAQTYRVGDPDPTPHLTPINRMRCFGAFGELVCTWMVGTDHPAQHVAGNSQTIVGVWDA